MSMVVRTSSASLTISSSNMALLRLKIFIWNFVTRPAMVVLLTRKRCCRASRRRSKAIPMGDIGCSASETRWQAGTSTPRSSTLCGCARIYSRPREPSAYCFPSLVGRYSSTVIITYSNRRAFGPEFEDGSLPVPHNGRRQRSCLPCRLS
jgi:hypothetical protein